MYLSEEVRGYMYSDAAFDSLFPPHIQQLSGVHWTPLNVAFVAAKFLAPHASARVIDIGAGVGKFCIAGACVADGLFTGIEQRKNFVMLGNKVIKKMGIEKAELVYGNFTELDISTYTGIYFYNSFHENLVFEDALDNTIEVSGDLYNKYSAHFLNQLMAMPVGTRLATFWLSITEIPGCYQLQESHFNNLLKLWIRVD